MISTQNKIFLKSTLGKNEFFLKTGLCSDEEYNSC